MSPLSLIILDSLFLIIHRTPIFCFHLSWLVKGEWIFNNIYNREYAYVWNLLKIWKLSRNFDIIFLSVFSLISIDWCWHLIHLMRLTACQWYTVIWTDDSRWLSCIGFHVMFSSRHLLSCHFAWYRGNVLYCSWNALIEVFDRVSF